jgi:SAM-dependent methyltransferase
MGIRDYNFKFMMEAIRAHRLKIPGLKMCELGNQSLAVKGIRQRVAKEYFEARGVKHVSIDLNGEDGALKLDLCKPITGHKNKYDIVTNCGTIEHVDNQYEGFKNIHNLCRVGGLMVHALPVNYYWNGHGLFQYYKEFFDKIAPLCSYDILRNEIINWGGVKNRDLVCSALIKRKDNEFIGKKEFDRLPILPQSEYYKKRNFKERFEMRSRIIIENGKRKRILEPVRVA